MPSCPCFCNRIKIHRYKKLSVPTKPLPHDKHPTQTNIVWSHDMLTWRLTYALWAERGLGGIKASWRGLAYSRMSPAIALKPSQPDRCDGQRWCLHALPLFLRQTLQSLEIKSKLKPLIAFMFSGITRRCHAWIHAACEHAKFTCNLEAGSAWIRYYKLLNLEENMIYICR